MRNTLILQPEPGHAPASIDFCPLASATRHPRQLRFEVPSFGGVILHQPVCLAQLEFVWTARALGRVGDRKASGIDHPVDVLPASLGQRPCLCALVRGSEKHREVITVGTPCIEAAFGSACGVKR